MTLSLMINHFITKNTHLFYHSQIPILNKMLRNTNKSHYLQRRDEMRGTLLDANYTAYQASSLLELLASVGSVGIVWVLSVTVLTLAKFL